MEQNVSQNQPSDEIDLRELVQTLWASKLFIIVVTLVVTGIAAAYAFLSTPIYQTNVQMLPPTVSGISSYNMGSQLTGPAINGVAAATAPTGIKELTTKDAYIAFLQNLASETIRQKFLEDVYIPAQRALHNEKSKEKLREHLNKDLTVTLPKPNTNEAKLTLEGKNPQTITDWANAYVSMAISATREDLLNDLRGEIAVRSRSLDDQISTLRKVALISRQDRITRLKDALHVAESIGLEVPSNSGNLITSYTGETMYLRGAKALLAELDILEKRTNDDPYIGNLPDLLKKQSLLKNIDLDPKHLSVAIIDRAAIAPEDPIKPKKTLILALGIILGAMLGMFIALTRHMFKA